MASILSLTDNYKFFFFLLPLARTQHLSLMVARLNMLLTTQLSSRTFVYLQNFTGNINCDGVQHHDVPLPVMTSAVMVRPLDWNNNVGLRMELYGCDPGM